jgi:acetyltransferase-like isoleucine patch superfamily enzyme
MIRSRLRRRVLGEPSIDELVRALSTRLPERLAAGGGRTVIGADNRLESVVLLGRGRYDATVEIGDECDLEGTWVMDDPAARIRIGSRTQLNHGCIVECIDGVSIGDDVLVAAETYISDNDSHSLDFEQRRHDHRDRRRGERDWSVVPRAPVWIESKAWIGRRAMILKGVTVGEGAVVAAGSVVTASVEPWTLVAGVPARAVRTLDAWPRG